MRKRVYKKDCNYFFTSDTEFNHKNIIKYCARPFINVEHMNEMIIHDWNRFVRPEDIVFHLGDVGRHCEDLVSRLNGQIVFVSGNHDNCYEPDILHVQIKGLNDEYGKPRSIILCHYAMRSWHKSHVGSWHLFGHSHGNLEPYGLSFDVGMDCWSWRPVSLEMVKQKMALLK